MNTEPVAIVASIQGVVLAVLTLLALELDWSGERVAAVEGIVMAASIAGGAIFARSKVTPT